MNRDKKPEYLIAVNEEQYGEIAVDLVKGTDTAVISAQRLDGRTKIKGWFCEIR